MEARRLVPFTSTPFRGMRPMEVCVPYRLRRNVMDQPVESAGTIAFLSRFGRGALHLNRMNQRSGRDLRRVLLCISGVLVAARKKKSENVLVMRQSASKVQVARAGRLAPSDVARRPRANRRGVTRKRGKAPPYGDLIRKGTVRPEGRPRGAWERAPRRRATRLPGGTCDRAMLPQEGARAKGPGMPPGP